MMRKRRIAVVTGTRAEYGYLCPVMKEIKSNEEMDLSTIVTGMHLSHEFGYTIEDIKKDGFKVDAEVDMILSGDSRMSMAKSLGIGIMGIAQALESVAPDFVLICGDRSEAFAAAVSASYLMMPVAHLHGGESTGGSTIDDSIRFSITKFAHVHFCATENHAKRVIRLGEEPWRVHVVGSTTLDTILNMRMPSPQSVAKSFSLDLRKPVALVVQHPTSIDAENAANEIRETMEALRELELQSVIIYPGSDPGGRVMIQVIKEYEKQPFIKAFENIPRDSYLALMSVANVMVGNSSSGVIEAPSFRLPVVNIGIRQEGRDTAASGLKADNIIDAGYNKGEIIQAIKRALYDKDFIAKVERCKNPYGDGRSSQRIVKILGEMKLDKRLLRKIITY